MSNVEIIRSIINTVRGDVDAYIDYDSIKRKLNSPVLAKQLDEIVLPKIRDELLFAGITVEHFKQHPNAFFYWIGRHPTLSLFTNAVEYLDYCDEGQIVPGEWRAAEGTPLEPILRAVAEEGGSKEEEEEEEEEEDTWACDGCANEIPDSQPGTEVRLDCDRSDDGYTDVWCRDCCEDSIKVCCLSSVLFDTNTCSYSTLGDDNVVLDYYLLENTQKVRLV